VPALRLSQCDRTARQGHRKGLYQCNDCREYSVTVGTVWERSKIGLHKWVLAAHLMGASKKGISSKQMQRMRYLIEFVFRWDNRSVFGVEDF